MLLAIEELSVGIDGPGTTSNILHDVSFRIREGEIVALVGESGSGKTTLLRAITALFPPGDRMNIRGTILFKDSVVFPQREKLKCTSDPSSIRYVFQEPASALNPALRIRSQFDMIRNSRNGKREIENNLTDDAIGKLLAELGITDYKRILGAYPHELSIGTLQRVLTAMALVEEPQLLIADEPTSAVDASVRRQILHLISNLCQKRSMGLLLATHDLRIAESYADQVIVLYAGRIVEKAPKDQFFSSPLHPYSKLLLASARITDLSEETITRTFDHLSRTSEIIGGCNFHHRCSCRQEDCKRTEPALIHVEREREVRCPYYA